MAYRFRLIAVFAVAAASACTPECVDKFDCPLSSGGKVQTCVDNHCVIGSPDPIDHSGGGTAMPQGGGATFGGGAAAGGGSTTGGGSGFDAGSGGGSTVDSGTGGGSAVDSGTGGGASVDSGTGGGSTVDSGTGGGAVAPVEHFEIELRGENVVPGVATTANGMGTATLTSEFDGGYTFGYSMTHSVAAPVAAVLHVGAVGGRNTSANVLGLGSNATSPLSNTSTVFPAAFVPDLRLTRTYVTISSSGFPLGEIRGQLVPAGHIFYPTSLVGTPEALDAGIDAGTNGGFHIILERDDAGQPRAGSSIVYDSDWDLTATAATLQVIDGDGGITAFSDGGAVLPLVLKVGGTGAAGTIPLAGSPQTGTPSIRVFQGPIPVLKDAYAH